MHITLNILAVLPLLLSRTTAYPADIEDRFASNETPILHTTSGPVQGVHNSTYTNVYQYLGVPFATPPLGDLRFAPPQPYKSNGSLIKAVTPPDSCLQYHKAPTIFSELVPGYNGLTERSEDCLRLNVYAPVVNSTGGHPEKLPVLVFLFGGGFNFGGIEDPYEDPTSWVDRTKDMIVVKPNYRLGIFGFPGAAGLDNNQQNAGLLDQRLAIEWLRDNIAAFGGDPESITLWGQSAGSESTDIYSFAWPKDPIVKSYILTSGSALTPTVTIPSVAKSRFPEVAAGVGCANLGASTQLACMRNVSGASILNFLQKRYNASDEITFAPVVNNLTVFSNYTTRELAGHRAKGAMIVGSNRNEGERITDHSTSPAGPNQTEAYLTTVGGILCPAVKTAANRAANGQITYRYEFAGNFSNISPLPWMGAYHGSILPVVYGTSGLFNGQPSTDEAATTLEMQRFWYAFMTDAKSLPSLGWPLNHGGTPNMTGKDAVALFGQTGSPPFVVENGAFNETLCAYDPLTNGSTASY